MTPTQPIPRDLINGLLSLSALDRFTAFNKIKQLDPTAPIAIDQDGRGQALIRFVLRPCGKRWKRAWTISWLITWGW